MRKRLLSILLLCCMVLTLLPTTALAEEAAPAFDLATDLADITIPNNLVTCVCTKANETKQYGQLTNGFSATKVAKEGNVWTVLISVKQDVYMAQFNKDTGSTHSPDGDHSNDFTTPIQFKLKYEENKWVLEGEMPQNKTLHFTCSGGHVYQGDIPVIKVVTRTSTDIKVTENNAWEYSIDNGATWQGSCHFTNLQPDTEYTIIARVRETATHKPSANSAPLTVTTMHLAISDELKDKLRAVASAYEGEYNGKEHEAVIVDDTEMPKGWRIAGYTTDEGNSFSNNIPEIKDAGTLRVGVKFVHPDYLMNITHYYTAEITPKPVTAGMIADIPSQHYTGHPIYPTPVIKDGNTPLVKDKDFTYSYDTNTSPEQGGKVTINGKGNYKGMASKSFNIVNEITEITEDDLKDLEIPTLVTVKCTTTNSSKEYGRIPGGFDLSKKPYMENGVWKAIVQLNLPAYKAKYDADTKKTHEIADLGGNLVTTFTLKYVNDKWELDGTFPNVIILVKCDGQHPQTPPYPTEENVSGLGDQIVAVLCNNVPTGQQSGKYYGLIGGGFTSTAPTLNADKVYESTITLIPSVYCNQFSGDTGIMHKVLSAQTTDGLKFVVKYDSSTKMWKPAEEVKQMAIWVTCDKHETDTPVPTEFTITFNGNGGTPSVGRMRTTNQKLTSLPTATRSGRYSFDGWYTAASGGTKITTATVFYENTAVYAHWTYIGGGGGYNPPVTYYTLRFETGGGSAIPGVRETYNTYIDLTKYVPTRHGYTFVGWYSEQSLVNKVSDIYLTGDRTVYAGWRAVTIPQTGDSGQMNLWSTALCASFAGCVALIVWKIRRREKKSL